MTTMRSAEVQNIHGETYNMVVRKHNLDERIVYGYPYSIRITNADPDKFDLNTHVFLYDSWQTAYKRFRELSEQYKTIKPAVMTDVDGKTGRCIRREVSTNGK